MRGLRFARVAGAAIAGLAAVQEAQAQDFYKGRTLTILVGSAAGGGYDAYARLLSRHMGRHMPGNPAVIVSNMPGASSLTSVFYLDTNAPKDGTAVDSFDPGNIGASRMGVSLAKVDFRNYNWIGSISQGTTGCFLWHTLGIKTLAEAKGHGPLHFALDAPGSPNDLNQKILRKIFGVDVQTVSGYSGAGAQTLAIERGEVDGFCGAWTSVPAEFIANKEIVPLIRAGPLVPDNMPKDVPYVVDIAPTPRDAQIIRLLVSSGDVARPYIASAAVPADRMKILRDGFDATMKDPDFLADAAKEGLPVSPENAAAAAKIVNDIYATPDDVVAAAREIAGD
jgi:tripartite-type tricarboxylate transporter receptor subunit TctC